MNKPTAVVSGTLVRGSHSYKIGGEWRIDAFTNGVGSGAAGVYNFSRAQTDLPYTQGQSLSGGSAGLPYASFLLGAVASASISNPTAPQGRKRSWGLYAQDSWRVTRKLSIEYGLRWDYQGWSREIHDRVSEFGPTVPNPSAGGLLGATIYQGYGPGRCNCLFANAYPYAVAPRLGLAYQINAKTVLRAGWGFTYGQTEIGQADFGTALGVGGWNTLSWSNPAYGEPTQRFRDGLSYNLADLYAVATDPGLRPSPGQLNAPPALVDPNGARPPRMNQWNIALQRQITPNLIAEAAYVGNRGVWFVANSLVNLNALTPERLQAFGLDIDNAANRTLLTSPMSSAAVIARGFRVPYAGFPTGSTLAQALRPFPQFSSLGVAEAPLGTEWYDSLQTKVTRRFSHGLQIISTFTWQKELSNFGQGYGNNIGVVTGNVNNVFNRKLQKSLSGLSEPFVFSIGWSYQLPPMAANRWVRAAAGGWTIGGILRYASGLPIPVPLSQNNLSSLLFQTTYFNRVEGQPFFLKDPNCHCIDPAKDLVMNPAAWSNPAAGQWGTAAGYYNDYRYQRRPDEQLSFGRVFHIREGMSFHVRAELFNAFNRTYMNDPVASNPLQTPTLSNAVLTGGFGYINRGSLKSQPRNGQIVARFQF
ncbi:MAG: TonB-dependent receptor [Acidobacteria bacterium]|nr:TonB-dependent receptor [Acidobacteriota bacterium]